MIPTKDSSSSLQQAKRRIGRRARRGLIIQAALEVFAERGYHAASLDEIAARAGITKAVLYDHFKSKSALHLFLLKRERDQLLRHVKERLSETGAHTAGVAEALDAFYGWSEANPYAWRMLFRETTGEPKVAKAHRKIQSDAHRAVIELLLAGHENDVRPGTSVEETKQALAAVVGGAADGVARWWYDNPDVARERIVTLTMDVLWQGLERARSSRPGLFRS